MPHAMSPQASWLPPESTTDATAPHPRSVETLPLAGAPCEATQLFTLSCRLQATAVLILTTLETASSPSVLAEAKEQLDYAMELIQDNRS